MRYRLRMQTWDAKAGCSSRRQEAGCMEQDPGCRCGLQVADVGCRGELWDGDKPP